MPEQVLCKICGKRRARRACPAVHGDICAICCGENREVTLSCPLDCEYLEEAHRREKPLEPATEVLANADIDVTESFLRSHEELLLFIVYALFQSAIRTAGAVDSDVLAALEALIQSHRTAESGLLYETRASNSVAALVQSAFKRSLEDYQKVRAEQEGLSPVRNSQILAMLVFLHRLGQVNLNGRPRGRRYIDLLRKMTPPDTPLEEPRSSILL